MALFFFSCLPCILFRMSNRLMHTSYPSPTVPDSLRTSHPSSTNSHKPNTLFLTQKRQQAHEAEILERHAELNGYIEELDVKVQRIVEHNEAELLFAYRNHLESVRLEMQEFKEETQQALQGEAANIERIETMEKQLIVFREQALKLFNEALKKDKEIEQLQMRLEESLSEKEHMDCTVKALIKRNKELEAIVRADEESRTRAQEAYLGRVEVNSFASLGISSHKKMMNRDRRIKDRILTNTSHNNSKSFTPGHFSSKQETKPSCIEPEPLPKHSTTDAELFARSLKIKLSYIDPRILENVVESAMEIYTFFDHKGSSLGRASRRETFEVRQTKSSLRSKSFHTCESNSRVKRPVSRDSYYRQSSEVPPDSLGLKDCFRRCVEVIRKEIARRKQLNTLNFFKEGCPISLEDFKKMDFMKLMELVFANQRLVQVLYWNLFNSAS